MKCPANVSRLLLISLIFASAAFWRVNTEDCKTQSLAFFQQLSGVSPGGQGSRLSHSFPLVSHRLTSTLNPLPPPSSSIINSICSLALPLSACVSPSHYLSLSPLTFKGIEEFQLGREGGGRLCVLHYVSSWRVDLLRGRRFRALFVQHHHRQAGENSHGKGTRWV